MKKIKYFAIWLVITVAVVLAVNPERIWAAAKPYVVQITGAAGPGGRNYLSVYDEDTMASNSDTGIPTQQSVKAYIDARAGTPDAANACWFDASSPYGIRCEGATANGIEAAITFGDPTRTDFTIAVPNMNSGDSADVSLAMLISELETNAREVANSIWGVSGGLRFEGSSADTSETTLTAVNPTADVTWSLPTGAAGTYYVLPSTLSTNGVDIANSFWTGTNQAIFECATANDRELILQPLDDATLADATVKIPSLNNANVMVSTLATNDVGVANSTWGVSAGIAFEGSVADAYETTVTVENASTADKTITFPDATGHVPLILKVDTSTVTDGETSSGAVAGSTLVFTPDVIEAAKGVEVVCGGTMGAGVDAAKTVSLLCGGTEGVSIATGTTLSGDWSLHMYFTVVNDTSQKSWGEFNVNGEATVRSDYDALDCDISAGETLTVQIAVGDSTDSISKQSCVWKLLP